MNLNFKEFNKNQIEIGKNIQKISKKKNYKMMIKYFKGNYNNNNEIMKYNKLQQK